MHFRFQAKYGANKEPLQPAKQNPPETQQSKQKTQSPAVLPTYCLPWMRLQMETAELLYGWCRVLSFKIQPQITVWL